MGDYNLHAVLSGFPGVLLTLVVSAELLVRLPGISERIQGPLRASVPVNLSGAVIGVLSAFFSGYHANEIANRTFQVPDDAIGMHHTLGRVLLFALIATAGLYFAQRHATFHRVVFQSVYLTFLVVSFSLVVVTGYLGGELVFTHGAAVRAKIGAAKNGSVEATPQASTDTQATWSGAIHNGPSRKANRSSD